MARTKKRIHKKRKSRRFRKQKGGNNSTLVYYINLDNRTNRNTYLKDSFKDYSITFERISAVLDANPWKGCALSFMKAIEKAKTNNLPYVFIMEDDCVPTQSFKESWPKIKSWLDSNMDKWDAFSGGNTYYYFNQNDKESICKIGNIDNIELYSTKSQSYHCMCFNSRIYDKMLEWKNKMEENGPIDLWLNKQNIKTVTSVPFIAVQNKGKSNIEMRNTDYTEYYRISEDIIKSIGNTKLCAHGGSIKKYLINYADKGYLNSRKELKNTALAIGGLDEVIEYGPNDIDENFRNENKKHFENQRGGGLWLWKPYLILKTLNKINEGDILVYCDAGASFTASIQPYIDKMKGSIMLFVPGVNEWSSEKYTKMDIFAALNAKDNYNVTHGPQIEAGFILLKKSNESIEFITKWLELCKNYHLISDEPSIEPNLPEFIENRHDQSILSALGKLYKDKYNIDIEKKPFISHHRRKD